MKLLSMFAEYVCVNLVYNVKSQIYFSYPHDKFVNITLKCDVTCYVA